jgi:hypothetical protein
VWWEALIRGTLLSSSRLLMLSLRVQNQVSGSAKSSGQGKQWPSPQRTSAAGISSGTSLSENSQASSFATSSSVSTSAALFDPEGQDERLDG